MSFHEIRFPIALSFGSSGGPQRRTEIVSLANGFEERNTPWEHSRRRYDAGVGLRSLRDVAAVSAFFEARRGQLHGFRWKDWADWSSSDPEEAIGATDQVIGTGGGGNRVFFLSKSYHDEGGSYVRPIRKPVEGSVRLALSGEEIPDGWSVDVRNGTVTFDTAPEPGVVVSAGFAFDVPVRFDIDHLSVSIESFQAGQVPSIPVVEVRL
jgi:uncharacterized protein (TIGR02217 family)